jgi:hypothetical protein
MSMRFVILLQMIRGALDLPEGGMRMLEVSIFALMLAASAGGCAVMSSGKEAVTVELEVTTPESIDAREALAKSVLADLPDPALVKNLGRRLPRHVLDAVRVSVRTRTERTQAPGGRTNVRILLECDVTHVNNQDAANEVADACRQELDLAVKARLSSADRRAI